MKVVFTIAGIVIALLIGLAIALPFVVNINNFHSQIESELSSTLGRPVKVGNLNFSVFTGSVTGDQLSIADDPKFSSAPFIQAKSFHVGVALLPLILSKHLNITRLVVDQPQIALLRDRDGVWNFSSLGNQAANQPGKGPPNQPNTPAVMNVAEFDVTDGSVSLGSVSGKRNPIVYNKVNVSARNFSFSRAFPVTVSATLPGGGSLKTDGTLGPIDKADTTLTPVRSDVKLRRLDLTQSALVDPELGITGLVDFDGTLSSDGHIAKARGTSRASSLKLNPKASPAVMPIQIIFAVEYDLQKETGKLDQGDVAIGKALAKLTGTFDMHGETTSIHMRFNGQAMPIDDLQVMIPAVGINLPPGSQLKGGRLSMELESEGPLANLTSSGWVRVNNTALAGFDLGSRLSALTVLTGKQSGNDTRIENLSSDVRHTSAGTQLDKINAVIPALGTVTGSGTISPSNVLDLKMVANLGGLGGSLTRLAGFGAGGIPVSIGGTTSNPTFSPDMKGMVDGKFKGLTEGKGNPLGSLFGKKKSN